MSKGSLNFYRNVGLEPEELKRWDLNLRSELSNFLYKYKSDTGGILLKKDVSGLSNDLEVTKGTLVGGYYTINIETGIGVFQLDSTNGYQNLLDVTFDQENELSDLKRVIIDIDSITDFEIPSIGSFPPAATRYVGLRPTYEPREDGAVSIVSASNQISITGGDFTKFLRGQASGSPVRIRFFDSDGITATNNGIYEVIDVISDTEAIISGDLVNESDLSYVVVGTFDLLKQEASNLADKSIYFKLGYEVHVGTTIAEYTDWGGFILAELTFDAGNDFTIEDLREDYLYNIGVTNLFQLDDVDLTGLVNTNILVYNSTSEKWEASTFNLDVAWTDITSLATSVSDPAFLTSYGLERRLLVGEWEFRGYVTIAGNPSGVEHIKFVNSTLNEDITPQQIHPVLLIDPYDFTNGPINMVIQRNQIADGITLWFEIPNLIPNGNYYFSAVAPLKYT